MSDWQKVEKSHPGYDVYYDSVIERLATKVPMSLEDRDGQLAINSFAFGRAIRISDAELQDTGINIPEIKIQDACRKAADYLDQICLGTTPGPSGVGSKPSSLYDFTGKSFGHKLIDIDKYDGPGPIQYTIDNWDHSKGENPYIISHPAFRKQNGPRLPMGWNWSFTKSCIDHHNDYPLLYILDPKKLVLAQWSGPEYRFPDPSESRLAKAVIKDGIRLVEFRVRRSFDIESEGRVRCFRLT